MSDFRKLRDMLCKELDEIIHKGEMTSGSLDVIDKLTHSIKSIDTIMAMQGTYSKKSYANSGIISELRKMMDETPDEETRHEIKRFISKMESL